MRESRTKKQQVGENPLQDNMQRRESVPRFMADERECLQQGGSRQRPALSHLHIGKPKTGD